MAKEVNATFWEHLDALRSVLFKIAVAVLVVTIVAFCFKDQLFNVVLAPKNDTFITYRLMKKASEALHLPFMAPQAFKVELINTGMAAQFLVHMKMAFLMAVLLVSPYILYALFSFISPALYDNERKYTVRIVFGGYVMFLVGVAVSYFLIFPLTFRFLGTYQVSNDVQNFISLESYIDTMMTLSLMMGLVFELPVLCWLFAKLGFLKSSFMVKYRRHAIVVILIIAAVITPTSDVFTLTMVSLPIYLLYEASIHIVKHTTSIQRSDDEEEDEESRTALEKDEG
jgi:sec-independent protein translocase protein TatC